MDLKTVRQIVDLIKRHGLTHFEVEQEGFKLKISRQGHPQQGPQLPDSHPWSQGGHHPHIAALLGQASLGQAPFPHPGGSTVTAMPTQATPSTAAPAASSQGSSLVIKSPMVGTFYTSPSPESPPFVTVGQSIRPESVVCIIEAMKVMNEIQAEVEGVIEEVLVKPGQAVEYGQPLFKLKTK